MHNCMHINNNYVILSKAPACRQAGRISTMTVFEGIPSQAGNDSDVRHSRLPAGQAGKDLYVVYSNFRKDPQPSWE